MCGQGEAEQGGVDRGAEEPGGGLHNGNACEALAAMVCIRCIEMVAL
ncbi:hypothetical protein RR42_s3485 [Cupriavidus basilensis]|uniref:Uncharacterized protein n=1 Tax=Cupriavidus basilensis TaxID=68895 RepID=A0A0C4YX83_9BURK|nr:hypothetical protein RR42_s3485 [Cupriavidus basilensis]